MAKKVTKSSLGTSQVPLRIRSIKIDKLFGTFDHEFDLNAEDRITILHGPNGVGKTAILSAVKSVFNADFVYLFRIPYKKIVIIFNDNESLSISQHRSENDSNSLFAAQKIDILFKDAHGSKKEELSLSLPSEMKIPFEKSGYISEYYPGHWLDIRSEQLLSIDDILSSLDFKNSLGPSFAKPPKWYSELCEKVSVHIIETDRLVIRNRGGDIRRVHRSDLPLTVTVTNNAKDLQNRIKEVTARYGTVAQRLDQTFPQRLLQNIKPEIDISSIQEGMQNLNRLREKWREIGLLDDSSTPPFDSSQLENLDQTQKLVMYLYFNDTKEKLDVLKELADRWSCPYPNVHIGQLM